MIEIKNRWDESVIFAADVANIRLAVELAVEKKISLNEASLNGAFLNGAFLNGALLNGALLNKASLNGAFLNGASLNRAFLNGASLNGASLNRASLNRASLNGALLTRASLNEASLNRTSLTRASLDGASLHGAFLNGAFLNGALLDEASLNGASLDGAFLNGASLRRTKGISKYHTSPLYGMMDQVGKIRAYKLTTADCRGTQYPSIIYEVGKTYEEINSDTNERNSCSYGINLATLDWCLKDYKPGCRIFVAEFEVGDIAAIPTGSTGNFRVYRCTIVSEKDVKQFFLQE